MPPLVWIHCGQRGIRRVRCWHHLLRAVACILQRHPRNLRICWLRLIPHASMGIRRLHTFLTKRERCPRTSIVLPSTCHVYYDRCACWHPERKLLVDPSLDVHPTVADEQGAFIRFLDIAGHDLRNPIAVLKSHVQLMQRRLNREEGRTQDLRDLGRMMFQIERLVVRLDTYLEAARIAQGQYGLQWDGSASDLGAIVRRLDSVYQVASRAHSVVFDMPDE